MAGGVPTHVYADVVVCEGAIARPPSAKPTFLGTRDEVRCPKIWGLMTVAAEIQGFHGFWGSIRAAKALNGQLHVTRKQMPQQAEAIHNPSWVRT